MRWKRAFCAPLGDSDNVLNVGFRILPFYVLAEARETGGGQRHVAPPQLWLRGSTLFRRFRVLLVIFFQFDAGE